MMGFMWALWPQVLRRPQEPGSKRLFGVGVFNDCACRRRLGTSRPFNACGK